MAAGRFVSRFPLPWVQGVGAAAGFLVDAVPNRERRIADINISACLPEFEAVDRRRLRRRALMEGGKLMLEMPVAWFRSHRDWIESIDYADFGQHARVLLKQGKGLIVVAPHLGNWEVGLHGLAEIARVTVLYRPPRQQSLEPVLIAGREAAGIHLVPIAQHGLKAMYAALRKGEMVVITPDQTPRPEFRGAGVYAPFFGLPALTMTLISQLARRTGAPVAYAFAERHDQGGRFTIRWKDADPAIADEDLEQAATALNAGVEACIRRRPEQYLWTYKRFKQSPGAGGIYSRNKRGS
ncbi:MAG: lysophospholipid acyltransferase family protein [Pseudomonadota bacterium]